MKLFGCHSVIRRFWREWQQATSRHLLDIYQLGRTVKSQSSVVDRAGDIKNYGCWMMWESIGTMLAVLTPIIGVPLAAITFYLRSLREHLVRGQEQLVRRVEAIERATIDIRRTAAEIERDYTSKDEWLRECMHTRRLLERLIEVTVRLDATMQGSASGHRAGLRPNHSEVSCASCGGVEAFGESDSILHESEGNAD